MLRCLNQKLDAVAAESLRSRCCATRLLEARAQTQVQGDGESTDLPVYESLLLLGAVTTVTPAWTEPLGAAATVALARTDLG